MHGLLLVLVLAGEPSMQMDLSIGMTGPRHENPDPEAPPTDATQGALYMGMAFEPGRSRSSDGGLFAGAGFEGTIDGAEGPYQWSIGFGPRFGHQWHLPGSPVKPLNDGYLYVRATPFLGMRSIAQEGYLHDEERRLTQAGFGVRAGVGFTAPIWSATVLGAMGNSGGNLGGMHFSNPGEALACLAIGVAIVLLNHAELTYEAYYEPGLPTQQRIGVRFGTGF